MMKKLFFVDVLNIVFFVDFFYEEKSSLIVLFGMFLFLNDCWIYEKYEVLFWVLDVFCLVGFVIVFEFFIFLMILLLSKCWIFFVKVNIRIYLMRYLIEFDEIFFYV